MKEQTVHDYKDVVDAFLELSDEEKAVALAQMHLQSPLILMELDIASNDTEE